MASSTPSWVESGAHAVTDGVHRIPLELPQDGLRAINVYVLETDSGIALIDSGWYRPETYDELATGLAQIGRRPDDIHDVFVTHIHRDHYTFGVELRRRHGARLHLGGLEKHGLSEIARVNSNVPETSLIELRRAGADDIAEDAYRLTVDEPFDVTDWEQPDGWLTPGPLPIPGRNLTAVHTPGHTKGHLVFHDLDSDLTFTGDHILPTITPSIGFELGEWELPLHRFLTSLELMTGATDRVMAPAHGAPGGDVAERAHELLAHHDRRFAAIEQVLSETPAATGLQVSQRLTWTRRERPFSALDTFNQMIAVCETLAHLDVLALRDRASVHSVDGVDHFSRA